MIDILFNVLWVAAIALFVKVLVTQIKYRRKLHKAPKKCESASNCVVSMEYAACPNGKYCLMHCTCH